MSNININNITPLSGQNGKVSISGSLHVKNDVTLGGNISLGDANTDKVVYAADVSSSIIPDADLKYNLGTPTKRWGTAFLGTASIGFLSGSVNGITFVNGTLSTPTASISYISGGSPVYIEGDLLPESNDTFNFGEKVNARWASGSFNNLFVSQSILFTPDDTGMTGVIENLNTINTRNRTQTLNIYGVQTLFSYESGYNTHIQFESDDVINFTAGAKGLLKISDKSGTPSKVQIGGFGTSTHATLIVSGTSGETFTVVGRHGHVSASGNFQLGGFMTGSGGVVDVRGTLSSSVALKTSNVHALLVQGISDSNTHISFGNPTADKMVLTAGAAEMLTLEQRGSTNATDVVTLGGSGQTAGVDFEISGSSNKMNSTDGSKKFLSFRIHGASGDVTSSGTVSASKFETENGFHHNNIGVGASQDLATSNNYNVNGHKFQVRAQLAAQLNDGTFTSFKVKNTDIKADSVIHGAFIGNYANSCMTGSILSVYTHPAGISASVFIHNENGQNIPNDTTFTASFVIL